MFDYFFLGPIEFHQIFLMKTLITIMIFFVLGLLFYIIDFIVLNMIKNKIIILDISYILRGKASITIYITSFLILCLEEILFRYYVYLNAYNFTVFFLISGSVCFGFVHIKFSRYDMFSKFFLGILCSIIFLLSNNILFSITFHATYSFFTLKNKNLSIF